MLSLVVKTEQSMFFVGATTAAAGVNRLARAHASLGRNSSSQITLQSSLAFHVTKQLGIPLNPKP